MLPPRTHANPTLPCGCEVEYITFFIGPLVINYCPLHKAAPLMLKALNMVEWKQNSNDDTVCPWCEWEWNTHHPDCPRQSAIAAAEPDSYQAEPKEG